MEIQWKNLIICLAIPLVAGGLSASLTRGSMEAFAAINKPPFAPPGYLMLPYLLWVTFAGYLNFSIYLLN